MRNEHFRQGRTLGFTLIELLIVIAIIAILALIAIPNFIEAQTRAKVSRAMADLRSTAMGVEAYSVDNNMTPPAAPKHPNLVFRYSYPLILRKGSIVPSACAPLTTPIAYITSLPLDVFAPRNFVPDGTGAEVDPGYGLISLSGLNRDSEMRDYYTAQGGNFVQRMDLAGRCAIYLGAPNGGNFVSTTFVLISAGPDRVYNYRNAAWTNSNPTSNTFRPYNSFFQDSNTFTSFTGTSTGAVGQYPGMGMVAYDPTNGTVSYGDIIRLAGGEK